MMDNKAGRLFGDAKPASTLGRIAGDHIQLDLEDKGNLV